MKTTNLRIGNIVLLDGDEIIITGIKGNTVWHKDGFDMTGLSGSKVEPILLTEEWLLKFGFKKGNQIYPKGFSLLVLNTDFYWGFNLEDKLDCELNDVQPINYVHQLQNLYFALAGEELQINESGQSSK
jgi:hypothetical protein